MTYFIRRPIKAKEAKELKGFSEILGHLLFHRNIITSEEAKSFIIPDYEKHVHDPFLLKDAEKAAERIITAIRKQEKIAIFSDYDADGIPGAAIVHDFFTRIGFKDFIIYIPHRHDEGFGLNVEAVENFASQKVSLLVTIDCGIADYEPVEKANELGIDVIITDHHEPPERIPKAFAIVDHKQKKCLYPDKNLCGSGVIFKVIQAILKKERFGLKEGMEKWLLDLVAIATLSDMVSLTGENRVLAYYGLQVLRKSPRKGLLKLFDMLKMNQKRLNEDDIAFMITPRINAASRMGQPMDAFNLLIANSEAEAEHYANHLDKVNNERKGIVASLVKEVKKIIHERYQDNIPSVLVLGNPSWRPALLGLVANTCAEEFDRPAFFWGKDGDNNIKGSCRSEGRTNVFELMKAVVPRTLFLQYGGHKHSGGFTINHEEIHYLDQRLNEAYRVISNGESLKTESPANCLTVGSDKYFYPEIIDMELTLDHVFEDLFEEVNKLAPFGTGNPKPVFLLRKVKAENIRTFGKNGDHVEIIFRNKEGKKIKAISFFGATSEWAGNVLYKKFDLVASIEKSFFANNGEIRLRIIDIIC